MKKLYYTKKQPALYLTLCFALLCWMLLFYQLITACFTPAQNTIPAFLPAADTTAQKHIMTSYPASAISAKEIPDQNDVYSFLKQYDKQIRMVSYHTEKNYTDIYFYSPALQEKSNTRSSKAFNLQAAITNSKVYLGTPFLQYDF